MKEGDSEPRHQGFHDRKSTQSMNLEGHWELTSIRITAASEANWLDWNDTYLRGRSLFAPMSSFFSPYTRGHSHVLHFNENVASGRVSSQRCVLHR